MTKNVPIETGDKFKNIIEENDPDHPLYGKDTYYFGGCIIDNFLNILDDPILVNDKAMLALTQYFEEELLEVFDYVPEIIWNNKVINSVMTQNPNYILKKVINLSPIQNLIVDVFNGEVDNDLPNLITIENEVEISKPIEFTNVDKLHNYSKVELIDYWCEINNVSSRNKEIRNLFPKSKLHKRFFELIDREDIVILVNSIDDFINAQEAIKFLPKYNVIIHNIMDLMVTDDTSNRYYPTHKLIDFINKNKPLYQFISHSPNRKGMYFRKDNILLNNTSELDKDIYDINIKYNYFTLCEYVIGTIHLK